MSQLNPQPEHPEQPYSSHYGEKANWMYSAIGHGLLPEIPLAAQHFLLMGLAHTTEMIYGDSVPAEASPYEASSEIDSSQVAMPSNDRRHVSATQLCLGLKDFAIQRYGKLARTVLERWNIRTTEDFGRIACFLIEHKKMRKSSEDRIDDFRDVFDFDEVFADLSSN